MHHPWFCTKYFCTVGNYIGIVYVDDTNFKAKNYLGRYSNSIQLNFKCCLTKSLIIPTAVVRFCKVEDIKIEGDQELRNKTYTVNVLKPSDIRMKENTIQGWVLI